MAKTNGHISVIDLTNGTPIAIVNQSTAYSESFVCLPNVTYAFEYQLTSVGNIDITIEIEEGNTPPETEGAVSLNMVVPEDAPAFDAVIWDELNHIKAYTPATARFLRAKITGGKINTATTTLTKFNVATVVNL